MSPPPPPASLSLAGAWRACLEPPSTDAPPPDAAFDRGITLPATTETAGLGRLNPDHRPDRLTAVRRIEGAVWYRREFTIPEAWRGRHLRLCLERTKASRVWLDGREVGVSALLCVPHVHPLGVLEPGAHCLDLCIDNRLKPAPGDNHQTSEHTQGNWNGVLGAIELRATGPQWIDSIAVTPDVAAGAFHLVVRLGRANECSYYEHSVFRPGAAADDCTARIVAAAGGRQVAAPAQDEVKLTLSLGRDAALWDEFSPALHRLVIRLESPAGGDERVVVTGLREFRRDGTQFAINGRPTFLRGEVNCCVFPATGHPPMDAAGWRNYFGVLRDHGLNHVRFHSWTPPDAAFIAADELGFYLATELPFWGEWTPAIAEALAPEGAAILRAYGHHPSFVLLTLGNEHRGDRAARAGLVARLRALDPSRLYAQGANNDLETPALAPADDCWITARLPDAAGSGRYANVRGSHSTPDRADGHVQVGPGGTRADYEAALAASPRPVVGHEIGQYSSYPRFEEISRYTGVFAAHNLERFRARAAAAGVLGRADAFARASSALAAICYREEIEAALRTPGFGGLELLGLQDFPGQGTALVGLLDAWLETKGAVTPAGFRAFCGPQVLLARFDRHVWQTGERFVADLEFAHYGPADLPAGELRWSLGDRSGGIAVPALARGGLRPLGRLQCILPPAERPAKRELTLTHEPSGTTNTWPLWIYPSAAATPPAGVVLTRSATEAQAALAAGRAVLLCADAARPFPGTPGGGFAPDFWCWSMFKNVPGTLGLRIDPAHPALAGFPTAEHADWQWFHLARAAQPPVLDAAPAPLVPFVEVIDNPERAHRLGLAFEARVGPGRLLVCAVDLPALSPQHPEAAALLASLLAYAGSGSLAAAIEMNPAELGAIVGA